MKMVMIVYNHALDDEMIEMLEAVPVPGYTKTAGAIGTGRDEPHMGDKVWPVTNSVIHVALDKQAQVKKVLDGVRALDKRFPGEGVRAFVWALTDIV